MQNVIKNMYKSKGLFICRHPVHQKFDFAVSPYHILKQKKCYKKGCVEFLWRCNVGVRGKKCPRGYKHVGRNCFSCKYYYEEKICRIPESLVDDQTLAQFFKDLDDYEFWLWMVCGRKVEFSGKVASVYPSLLKTVDNDKSFIKMSGFLITFDCGYIGDDLFDDTIYLQTSAHFLSKWQPAPGDELDFEATLNNDRGRIVLTKPSRVEIARCGAQPIINYSKALVGRATGIIVSDDTRLCRNCPYGALLDVEEIRPKQSQYRRFYCLQGVEFSKDCLVRLERKLQEYFQTQTSTG